MIAELRLYKKPKPNKNVFRIDKGYRRGALDLARQFITMIDVIVYYRCSERVYCSLFNDVYIILIGQY